MLQSSRKHNGAVATFGAMNVRFVGAGAIGSTVAVCGGMTAYPDAGSVDLGPGEFVHEISRR
jgi:hypothetical protein